MSQMVPVVFVLALAFLAFMAVIYEPAWRELLRSREARRRREEHARDQH